MLFKKNNNIKEAESEELFNNPYIIEEEEETSENAPLNTSNGKTPLLSEHSKEDVSFDTSYEEADEDLPISSTSTHFDLDIVSDSIKEKNEEKESLLPTNKTKKKSTTPSHPLQSTEEDEISVLPTENEQTNDTDNNAQITEKVTVTQQTTATTEAVAKKAHTIIGGNDGVFANLSAKPQINKPSTNNDPPSIDSEMEDGPPSEPLPNYDQTMQEPSPPQFDNMTFIPMAADDVLVDHLPVGSIYAFLWSFIVSFMFDWVGFVLTYLLHINHSGRFGSFAGLGATLIKLGIYFIKDPNYFNPDRNNNFPDIDNGNNENDGLSSDNEKVGSMMGYMMLAVGFMFLIKSLICYHRVIKIRREMLASSPLPI